MAGISFLDLMLADALAAGLAREARRAEKPPPDNFFVMPRELRAWKNIQEASKKEYMVVCMEFTDEKGHTPFLNLAREFDSIPFLRVPIGLGPGGTFEELRKDVGGVQYIPTILLIFFGDNGKIFRAKFEGSGEIRQGLANGRIKGIIKEFIERRVKLKLAEHVAEELADAVKTEISEKERRIRDEYETKMRREMAEKDEKAKQAEDERKRKEEEEQRALDAKRMRANEIRREARPQHLEELMRMDLDKSSAKELKQIMMKMGIPTHDCFEKGDLKKKLIDNVPELRMEMERRRSSSSLGSIPSPSSTTSFGIGRSDSNASFSSIDLERDLKESKSHLRQMTARANQAEDSVVSLKVTIQGLERQIKTLKSQNSAPVPKPRTTSSGDSGRIKLLETELRESRNTNQRLEREIESLRGSGRVKHLETELFMTRTLYTSTIEDFQILGLIHDSGEEGMVLRAKCTKPTLPNKDRVYAMKVLTNYFQTQTQTQARHQFQNEYQVLCQLPPHENLIHMWAFFFDRADPNVSSHFNRAGKNVRTMSLFILMDEHLQNMKELLATLVDLQGPKPQKVLEWFRDLLSGLVFLEKHNVVHRDLKMENLLSSSDGKVVISDFGKAVVLSPAFELPYMHGMDKGGNTAHMSPEILNARPGRSLSYSKQPVWAAGVLAFELAGHPSPFASGSIDQRGYHNDAIPRLEYTFCTTSRHRQSLPSTFTSLVKRMLDFEARSRPTLRECLDTMNKLV